MANDSVEPSSSALRPQTYRRRQREGADLIRLCIAPEGAQDLQRLGWLGSGDVRNATAIAEAVLALGSTALTAGLRPPVGLRR
jgi:hypothetical protein